MGENKFTEDDYNKFQEALKFILNKAHWNVTTAEALALNKHLSHFNNINQKINDHILELKRVVKPDKDND